MRPHRRDSRGWTFQRWLGFRNHAWRVRLPVRACSPIEKRDCAGVGARSARPRRGRHGRNPQSASTQSPPWPPTPWGARSRGRFCGDTPSRVVREDPEPTPSESNSSIAIGTDPLSLKFQRRIERGFRVQREEKPRKGVAKRTLLLSCNFGYVNRGLNHPSLRP